MRVSSTEGLVVSGILSGIIVWHVWHQLDHADRAATCEACFVSLHFCPTVPTDSGGALLGFGVQICYWLFLLFVKFQNNWQSCRAPSFRGSDPKERRGGSSSANLYPLLTPRSEVQRSKRKKGPSVAQEECLACSGKAGTMKEFSAFFFFF